MRTAGEADRAKKRGGRSRPLLVHLFTVSSVVGLAGAFYFPALRRSGVWPAPLDDVFIHFDFARSIAEGRPFEWMPGNGYSSGATSLLYPFVLAPGYLVGFRGAWLGLFAALVACACLVDLCRSLRELAAPAPAWVSFAIPPLVLCLPLLDWSLFSGMEVALFGAALGRAACAVRRAERASIEERARAQLRAGALAALLVAVRPEAIALAVPIAVAVAHAAGTLSGLGSLARAAGPTALLMAAQAAANRTFTGEWAAAGAVRKLLTSDPYSTRLDTAIEVMKNLIALRTQAFDAALGGWPYSAIFPALAVAAAFDRRSRRVAAPLVIGAVGALVLVAFNATARFQNWRYAAPSLLMLLAAATLGAASLVRRVGLARGSIGLGGGRVRSAIVATAVGIAVVAPSRTFARQIDHFARASANIREQQAEAGLRLAARSPAPRRVFLSDAGAIPYFSRLPALDGLGLGGFRDLPFARASVHGVPAVIELMERMEMADRPDVLAVYPSWWVGLADVFGRRFDGVRIEDNVICAAPEKVLYDADLGALAPPRDARPGAVDELDVADLVDERAHRYEAPAPRGGWVIGAVLPTADGTRRFDAGRIVPQGRAERFHVAASVARGPAHLILRTDAGPSQRLRVVVERAASSGGAPPTQPPATEVTLAARPEGRWTEVVIPLAEVGGGDIVSLESMEGAFRDFHVWLLR